MKTIKFKWENENGVVIDCLLEFYKATSDTLTEPASDPEIDLVQAMVDGHDVLPDLSDEVIKMLEEKAMDEALESEEA